MSEIRLHSKYDSISCRNNVLELQQKYPFIVLNVIGTSLLGRPIFEISVGEGEKKIHWNGAFHANEWITSPLLIKSLERYCNAIVQDLKIEGVYAQNIYDQIKLSIVPMVNPDGVDLFHYGSAIAGLYKPLVERINAQHNHETFTSWKANIRGVDLNNQFPANWDIEQKRKPILPSFRDFPGYCPLSEPEALAMHQLSIHRSFDRVLAFHSQGEVIYYGYNQAEPSISKDVVSNFQKKSGYLPIRTIDSHAGYKDWYIQHFRKEGYTIEVGKGINPLPWSTFNEQDRRVSKICMSSLIL
ncbi:M14 family metallopeptidase [Pontibacillus yanchengensis]|uniref:Peptidase M14 n=1 Tax=Pontibacillus yanchengensis Y32 TaxID=1385514 RepID=A0A0A2TBN8_9BACI|nr:M14 family metallocarboxypeptidase [Pontibacillus yanchengensis]KGP72959.1 peptidase M14 [Pontibacillus yanchengensis Y32]